MTTTAMGAGATKGHRLNVRVETDEQSLWESVAEDSGVSLSAWVRQTLNAAAVDHELSRRSETLSSADFDALLAALDEPETPEAAAFRAYVPVWDRP